jgi:hypothetical protein
MDRSVDRQKLELFMTELGQRATSSGTVYITGGSTALLLGIRDQTMEIDIKLDPEPEDVFEAIAELKVSLGVNIELASPDRFIPELPGWRDRSRFIIRAGQVDFRHYDFYAQAIAKIERAYKLDVADARALIGMKLIEMAELERLALAIRLQLKRYPAIDPDEFYRKIATFVHGWGR